MRVVVALDSFKGTFTAERGCALIAAGVGDAGDQAVELPVADGGEGTLSVLLAALGGTRVSASVLDPLGRQIQATWGLLEGGSKAVVETAAASGLHLVDCNPSAAYDASKYGTGQLIASAAAAGVSEIVVGLGGSATSDGGSGAIEAINDAGGLRTARLTLLCDVTTCYEHAPTLFGPQKGADAATVRALNRRQAQTARALPRDPRRRAMTGAAGGLSGALWSVFDAELTPGAARMLDVVGFDETVARCDAVITGEGRLDHGSYQGKLVGEVARRCRLRALPVHAVVGSLAPECADDRAFATITVASTPAQLREAWRSVRSGAAPWNSRLAPGAQGRDDP